MEDLFMEESVVGRGKPQDDRPAASTRLMYTVQEKRLEQQALRSKQQQQRTQEKILSLLSGGRSKKQKEGKQRESQQGGVGGGLSAPDTENLGPSDSWVSGSVAVEGQKLSKTSACNHYLLSYICQLELKHLVDHAPKGVYVLPSDQDERLWNGVVFVAEGLYANALFRFTVTLPDNFPKATPSVNFDSFVWHPQIDLDTGSMTDYVYRHFPTWDSKQNRISDVLRLIAMSFLNIDTANAANPAAAEMCMADAKLFEYKARECVSQSHYDTFECREGSSINFHPYNPGVHDRARVNMINKNFDDFGDGIIDLGVRALSQLSNFFRSDE